MANFDFDTVLDRRSTNSYKWDTTPAGVTPMWVADMDFRTAPAIIEGLRKRVEHGIFGYTAVPEEYYTCTSEWFSRRHGWRPEPTHIIYTSGVVPAISAIIKAATVPGDKVICFTPAYNCFFSSIRNNGCLLAACPLKVERGVYAIDWNLLEQLASDSDTKVLLLCNPHNPGGRVWTRTELERIDAICRDNGIFIISDEIHCELTYPGHDYTPLGTLGHDTALRSAVCISPSKAFNIAGLQIASIVAGDSGMRARIDRTINDNEVCDVNPFGVIATIEAYCHGEAWLNALLDYLDGNRRFLDDFMRVNLPEMPSMPLQSTYLSWIECSATGLSGGQLEQYLVDEARVRVNGGEMYGPGGENYIRINLACPRSVLADALQRISAACAPLIRRQKGASLQA